MKRRNADCGKLRRPPKRNKITEGIYGSTFLYLKFLMVWALVLMADFILEFRFEYLWPFWLLLRSVYDSFKFQGLAFSVFFVCVAVTSDVICYLFIPVQWLFFASSTYVWVQYVWHTERGVCIPTICLWTLFVYMEASIRLSVVKSMPFHLDLCRPFAAHCIGYPVVTLGFGFKSYISYKMRVRKQKVVQKENEFYVQLLQQALPIEQQAAERQKALAAKAASLEESISTNGSVPNSKKTNSAKTDSENQSVTAATNSKDNNSSVSSNSNHHTHSSAKSEQLTKKQHNSNHTSSSNNSGGGGGSNHSSSTHIEDYQYIEQSTPLRQHSVNDYDQENYINDQQVKAYKSNGVASSGSGKKLNGPKENNTNNSRKGKGSSAHIAANGKENLPNFTNNKEEVINGLEGVVKKLRTDLQSSRSAEQEMRAQLTNLMSGDKTLKNEVQQLRQDNESLQNKLHNLVTSRQQDKANLGSLESKLQDERKKRTTTEQQLAAERKAKKAEEQATARAMAMANAFRSECTESCKTQRRELETDIKQYKHDIKAHEEQIRSLEHEVHTLRQYKDSQGETDVLMSALSAMQDKNAHLENSLSAETRVKMDLFSALGDAKRQLEIQTGILNQRDQQICELKSKVAEVMALMPATASSYSSTSTMLTHSSPSVVDSPHFAAGFSPAPSPILSVPQPPTQPGQPPQQPPPQQQQPPGPGEENVLNLSSLNPNASDYTPKVTQ